MARPTKQGIEYFPLDCNFDNETEMYLIEKGSIGLSVLVTLWQMIYNNEGYYINDNKDLYLLIKKRINVDINEINDCINVCLNREIFNSKLHKKYKILTSSGIQKRFLTGAKRKKAVNFYSEYLVNGVFDNINQDNVCINSINDGNNATKEEVKEEVKENINNSVDEIKSYILKKLKFSVPKTKIDDLKELIKTFGYDELIKMVDRWNDYRLNQNKRRFCFGNRWNKFYENISIVESDQSLKERIYYEKGKYIEEHGVEKKRNFDDFENQDEKIMALAKKMQGVK
jgi:hypothetical protein